MEEEGSGLDVSEVYFLVLHWLGSGPCRGAAEALLQEVQQHGLLPRSYAVSGASRPTPYQQLLQQHSNVPPTGLLQLLQQALKQVQQSGHAGAQGLSSLLAEGPLAALPSLRSIPAQRQLPAWLTQRTRAPSLAQQLLLREGGVCSGSSSRRLPLRSQAARYSHQATFRGHGFPVFCVLFDHKGSRIVTGADDSIIKVWSVQTGMLLVSARGHTGELADLSLSCDGQLLASGATDGEVRIWSMKDSNLGQNLAVLRGHAGPVNLIDFHPRLPLALLSASNDGTVRLWDASDPHFPPIVLSPAGAAVEGSAEGASGQGGAGMAAPPAAAVAAAAANAGRGAGAGAAPDVEQDVNSAAAMLGCAWSPCGTYIAAGSRDCNVHMWRWGISTQASQGPAQQHPGSAAGTASAGVLHAADWPQPEPLPVLRGHSKGVWQVEFNHTGSMLASGSMDGSARVWVRPSGSSSRTGEAAAGAWLEACPALVLTRIAPAAPAGGPAPSPAPKQKQRRPAVEEALTVNRVLWTADDSKLLLAGSDRVIRVWDVKTWSLQQLLQGHTDAVHVLEGHPLDPRLVMSAGYDGLTILWDAQAGTELQRFSSSDTPPLARGSWAPPVIQVVEGRFSPDGTSFVIADAGGQFSLYALGVPPPLLLAAPYDQFFSRDYDPIVHDAAGFAAYADPSTGVVVAPVWQAARQYAVAQQAALQQPLCDNHFRPYPEGFQAAYRAGQVLDYVKSGEGGMSMRGSSMSLPQSLEQWPPTVTAAVWKALEDRSELAAKRSGVPSEEATREAAERQALEQHSRLLSALARGMTLEEEALHVAQVQAAAAAVAAAGGQQPAQPVPAAAGLQTQQQAAGGVQAAVPGAASRGQDAFADQFITQEDVLQDLLDDRDNDVIPDSSDSDYSASAHQEASSSGDLEGLGSEGDDSHSSSSGGAGHGGGSSRRRSRRRSQRRAARRQRQEQQQAGSAGHNLRPRRRRGGSSQREEEEEPQGGMATRSRPHTRRAAAEGVPDPEEQLQLPEELQLPPPRQQRKRRALSDSSTPDDEPSSNGSDDARRQQRNRQRRTRRRLDPAGAAAGGGNAAHGRRQQQRAHAGAEDTGSAGAVAAAAAAGGDGEPDPLQAWRPGSCYSWLNSAQQLPGLYVPQLGDAVVYVWQGHRQCLEVHPNLQQVRPWECFEQLGQAAWQQQQQWQQQWEGQQQQWQQWGYDPGGQQLQWQQGMGEQAAGGGNQSSWTGAGGAAAAADGSLSEAVAAALAAAAAATGPDTKGAAPEGDLVPPVSSGNNAAAGAAAGAVDEAAGEAASGAAGRATAAATAAAGSSQKPADVAAQQQATAEAAQQQAAAEADRPPAATVSPQLSAEAGASELAAAAAAAAAAVAASEAQSAGTSAVAADEPSGPTAPQVAAADPPKNAAPGPDPGWDPAAPAAAAGGCEAAGAAAPSQSAGAGSAGAAAQPFKLRFAEPCVVTGLEYVLLPGDFTAACLTLQLSDPDTLTALAAAAAAAGAADPTCGGTLDPAAAAAAAQGCFQVVLPPPELGGCQGCVLLQSQFLTSLERTWEVGSRVQGCCLQQVDEQPSHSWRLGTVTAVKDGSLSQHLHPYSSNSRECYRVQWDDAAGSSSEAQAAAGGDGSGGVPAEQVDPEAAAAAAAAEAAPPPAEPQAAAAAEAAFIPEAAAAATAEAPPVAAAAAAAAAAAGDGSSEPAAAAAPDAVGGGGEAAAAAAAAAVDAAAGGGDEGPAGCSWCSPWKLYPAGVSAEEALAVEHAPGLTSEEVAHMLQKVNQLRSGRHKVFDRPPSPAALFESQTSQGSCVRAYNRVVALPMGLANIQARLRSGYYRSMQALLYDAALVAGNAATFNGPESELAKRAAQMYNALCEAAYALQGRQQQQQLEQQSALAGWPAAAAMGAGPDGSMQWQQGAAFPAGVTTGGGEQAQQQAAAAGAWDWQWQQHSAGLPEAAAAAAGCAGDGTGDGTAQLDGSWYQQQLWPSQQQQQQQPSAAAGAAAYAAGFHTGIEQQGMQPAGEGGAAAAAPAQQRPRIRLRMRLPGQHTTTTTAAAAADSQAQAHSGGRSRRPAAQRARAFVAAVAQSNSGSDGSQPESDYAGGSSGGEDGGSSCSDEGRGRGSSRRRRAVLASQGPTRHSARLQQQGGARQYRGLAEGSEAGLESDGYE